MKLEFNNLTKSILAFLTAILVTATMFAQVPNKMSYQAIIRNAGNNLVTNTSIGMQISILQGSATGAAVYIETYNPNLSTNANGLVMVEIGSGTPVSGTFANINWANGPYFLKTETDPAGGTNYTISGVGQFLSVPYALHAKTVEVDNVNDADADPDNEIQAISLNGSDLTLSKNGGTVSLPSSGGLTLPYSGQSDQGEFGFEISNIKYNGIKGVANNAASSDDQYGVAGFASGPKGKGVYGVALSTTGETHGVSGVSNTYFGSGVYGINLSTTGWSTGVTGVTSSNTGVGVTGKTTASSGFTIGVRGVTSSNEGVGVWGSSYSESGSGYGVYGVTNSSQGQGVYGRNTSMERFTIGVFGKSESPTGYGVVGEGKSVGVEGRGLEEIGTGVYGTGNYAGVMAASINCAFNGICNSETGYAGKFQGRLMVTQNVGIGIENPAYKLDVAGTANLNSGKAEEAVALRCNGDEALWYNGKYFSWGYGGDYNYFATPITIGTNVVPGYALVVNGTAAKSDGGVWSNLSDIRLKNLTGSYNKGLNEIISLQPVTFTYKEGNPRNLDSKKEQIGFVAQEVQKIFPEAVNLCSDGYLDFNMHAVNVALVNAVKELKAENDLLKAENEQIDARLTRLEKIFEASAMK